MNMPYKTSRDYQLLKKLLDERMRRCDTERVGLGDNWEDIYDSWNKEMK